MGAIVTEIISILVAGISGIATGIGSGLQNLVESVFLSGTGENVQLSAFGGVVVVFAGVSLAIGLSTLVVNWVMNLGK